MFRRPMTDPPAARSEGHAKACSPDSLHMGQPSQSASRRMASLPRTDHFLWPGQTPESFSFSLALHQSVL
jgi:hypothetical protein